MHRNDAGRGKGSGMARWTLAVLALGTAPGAWAAQTAPVAPTAQTPAKPPATATANAQNADAVDPESDAEEIVVTGRPPPGSVPGDIKPELQLSPADIRSFGSSSIADLMTELGPQLQSVRGGPPVILIDGRRSAGMQEIQDFPPEALLRIDILPEEVALKFGYRSDQKVINFVMRPRFRSYTADVEGSTPTEGGTSNFEGRGGLVRIDRGKRLNVNLQAETTSNLLESERDIIPNTGTATNVVGDVVDTTRFRSLSGASDRFSANGVYARRILGVSASATARVEHSRNESLLGLPSVSLALPANTPYSPFPTAVIVRRYPETDPLTRNGETTSGNAAFALNGDVGRWRWSLNGNYNRSVSDTRTERGFDATALQAAVRAGTLDPFGDLGNLVRIADRAHSVSSVAGLNGLIAGSPFALPAGEANTSIRVAGTTNDFRSDSTRSGVATATSLGRDNGSVRANIDLPIANAARDVLPMLGRLSLNGNVELEQLSDFGTLTSYGYGVNWQPVTGLRMLASVSREENAPSQGQLGNPTIVTPLVRRFDYVLGTTVDVTTVSGGNPNLVSSESRVVKLGLNIRPWTDRDLSLQVDFSDNRTDNPIQGFPVITADIQAAFPERFTRDASGVLTRVDSRPVNFDRSENSQLRWGLNFSKSFTTARSRQAETERAARMEARRAAREAAEANGAPPPDAPPPGGDRPGGEGRGPGEGRGFGGRGPGGFGGPGGPGGGGFGGRGGGGSGNRFWFGFYHTVILKDQLRIREGLPVLDLLDGNASNEQGGTARHRVTLNSGYSRDGLGLKLNGQWQSGTSVDAGTNQASDLLRFSSLTKFDLQMFIKMDSFTKFSRSNPFFSRTQLNIDILNIFNSRQKVHDANGLVPTNFQSGYIDAKGRVLRLSFRKLFP